MKNLNRYLPIALFFGFLSMSIIIFIYSKPTLKSARVYKIIREYSPYYLEKRFGGLEILDKRDKEFKLKPSNESLFKTFEELERKWGKRHIRVSSNKVFIVDDKNTTLKSFELKNKKERDFIKRYYGI